MKRKIAIFASGSGTNAEAIAKYFAGNEAVEVALLVCNKPDAGVLGRMELLGVPSVV